MLWYYHLFPASSVIPTTWQEGIFSSPCSLYHTSLFLCVFHMDSLNHTNTQRTDPIEYFFPSLNNNIYQKNQNVFCISSFPKILSAIFASIMAIWSYATEEGSFSKASHCSFWNHALTALSLLLSEGHQYLLPGSALQQSDK